MFSSDCQFLLVASAGRPEVVFETGIFADPEGSITQFHFTGPGPTITKVILDFTKFNAA